MFEKVLVATDFSEYAHKTVECVTEIPGVREVILLHVMEASDLFPRVWISGHEFDSPLDRAREYLQKGKEYLEENQIPTRTVILKAQDGDITRAVISCAEKENVGLIMIGARGKGIIGDFLLGSVSSHVLQEARTHVLITQYPRADETSKKIRGRVIDRYSSPIFQRVLIPVDFSRISIEGIEFMRDFEGVEGFILLHVISSDESREELEVKMKESYMHLQHLGRDLDTGSAMVQIHIRFGSPVEEICNLAEEENATLIMISRFGESDNMKKILIGNTAVEVAKMAKMPIFVRYPAKVPDISVRELEQTEFWLAEELWGQYPHQKADILRDRIFGVFMEDTLVCVARCRRHPDGLEVDAIFTLDEFRGRGYATKVMDALVEGCGSETLYMHSTLELVEFYTLYGFIPIEENELPHTIKDGFSITSGEMEGTNVQPMKREPGQLVT